MCAAPDAPDPVPDVVAPGLAVLFCGINPSLRSAATGHHFAHPANRFWKVLHGSGFTAELLAPGEDEALLSAGLGITNLVARPTRAASELTPAEIRRGVDRLTATAVRWAPGVVAVVGMGAYRTAFRAPKATIGPQERTIGASRVWLVPNPSGLQARYQMEDLVAAFTALQVAVGR